MSADVCVTGVLGGGGCGCGCGCGEAEAATAAAGAGGGATRVGCVEDTASPSASSSEDDDEMRASSQSTASNCAGLGDATRSFSAFPTYSVMASSVMSSLILCLPCDPNHASSGKDPTYISVETMNEHRRHIVLIMRSRKG